MKICYYVILFRPKGSHCWTPLNSSPCGRTGNFFAHWERAAKQIDKIKKMSRFTVWLKGEKRWTNTQFKIGWVIVTPKSPTIESPPPSPNLKPPKE